MYDEIINRWKNANPVQCHELGLHEFDGKLPDFSTDFIQTRILELKNDIHTLNNIKIPQVKQKAFEYHLLLSSLSTELFELDQRKEFSNSPLPYIYPLGLVEESYTARSFAPLETRIQAIISLEQAISSLFQQARVQLKSSLPKPKVEMGINILTGHLAFFKDKLGDFINTSEDKKLVEQWKRINLIAISEIDKFLEDLKYKYFTAGHDNFALGEVKFLALLEHTEGVKSTVDQLLDLGQKELDRNFSTLIAIANRQTNGDVQVLVNQLFKNHPTPEGLLPYVEQSLEQSKQFLIDNDLVTIPTDDQCMVKEMPESFRDFAFASMSTPGPFEPPEAKEAYYYVNPPDLSWTKEKITKHLEMFNYGVLANTTVHEAWPGHYLQLLYSNKTSSIISKMFADSYSMVEGWGLYTEEMMVEQGYAPMDKDLYHVAQLLDALVRDVRFVSALNMHCRGKPLQEVKSLFMEKSFLPGHVASIEANRGTVDPLYLNYTLGKLMIKKLHEDYKKEQGDNYTLKKFHDTLLSFGSPPITILRNMVLENPGGLADSL